MGEDGEFTATFGPYQIRSLLGSGRIASVFDAVQGEGGDAGRPVALKVFAGRVKPDADLSPSGAAAQGIPGVRVQHPALAQLYEVGRVGDNLFVAMEHVDGVSLAHLLSGARENGIPVEPQAILALALQLADGLRALHVAEVEGSSLDTVHGDLRPVNVLVSRTGQAKLADWGVAAVVRAFSDLEDADPPLAPPLYVSPEQSRGKPTTPASDVFCWGILVLELMIGTPVFITPTEQGSLRKLRGVTIKGPLKKAHAAFPELAPVVQRALSKAPDDRYADGAALSRALEPLAPPSAARDLLAQLVGEVLGEAPPEPEFDDDELMDRVSHLSGDDADRSVSSFVFPPSDPIAAAPVFGLDEEPPEPAASQEPAEQDEPSESRTSTDDLTATDEIGVTEELQSTEMPVSPSGGSEAVEPDEESLEEDTHGDQSTDDGEGDELDGAEEPDATETLPADGVRVDGEGGLDPDLEISAFNPPSTDDDFLETTVPPILNARESREAKASAEAAGRKTDRVFQGSAQRPTRSAKKKPEKVTVWTGTAGRPETVTPGAEGEKKPGIKWPWILISVAAVILLAMFVISELTPARGGRDRDGADTTGDGGGAGATTDAGATAGRDGGTTGAADRGTDGAAGTDAGATAEDGGEEPATEPPLLDPSILGDEPPPIEEETPAEREPPPDDGADAAAEETTPAPPAVNIGHSPVSRAIRGRAVAVSVSVEPPGSYQGVIWYRAAGGPWQQAGIRGGEDGTLAGSIPHGAWLGNEADQIDYYVEVMHAGGKLTSGSAVSPHPVKVY